MSAHLLFVCSGNTCRSPLAEAMARRIASERGLDIVVSSAGTGAADGMPASDGSLLVGVERNLDLTAHRSRLLTANIVAAATVVLAMGPHHAARVVQLGGAEKTALLTDYAAGQATGRGISDPFGAGLDAYRRMADELDALLPRVMDRVAREIVGRGPGTSTHGHDTGAA